MANEAGPSQRGATLSTLVAMALICAGLALAFLLPAAPAAYAAQPGTSYRAAALQTASPQVAAPQAVQATLSKNQKKVTVTARGAKFAKATAVYFPTWSEEGGQDDLIWHRAKKKGGTWTASFSLSKHSGLGTYRVHAYTTVGTRQRYAGQAAFALDRPTADVAVCSKGNGFYRVEVSNTTCPSGVAEVAIPSWSNAKGQDDLVWHAAKRTARGTWAATIAVSKHKGGVGKYLSDAYITDGNGNQACIGGVTHRMQASDYVYVTGSLGSGKRTVSIVNPSRSGTVRMHVWSQASKRKDLVRYAAKKKGSHLWTAQIDCNRLKKTGKVTTQIYAGGKPVAETAFKVNKSDLTPSWKAAKAKLRLTTAYRGVFNHGPKPKSCQKYIVLHDTEGDGDASTVVNWWVTSGQRVAAHFIVNKDGSIVQCVPLDRIAHHAGFGDTGHNRKYGVTDESRDDKKGTASIGPWAADYGMNSYSIGIEMVHVGGSGYYPAAQLKALDNLIAYIDAYYGRKCRIIDHKAWRSGNSDTSPEFAGYLRNYQKYRKHAA